MKQLLTIVTLLLFCGCRAPEFIIKLTTTTSEACIVEINDKTHDVTSNSFEYKVKLRKKDYLSVSADFASENATGTMRLSLHEDGREIIYTEGSIFRWIHYSYGEASASTNYYGSSSSGGGSSSSSYCGAPTKDGTPCKRKVSGGGYCWQHD